MTDVFKFDQLGIEDGKILGKLSPTDIRSLFVEYLKTSEFEISPEMFSNLSS